MKRLFAILIAAAMVFSVCSVSASADSDVTESDPVPDKANREQRFVEMLNEAGYPMNPWEVDEQWYIYHELYTTEDAGAILVRGMYFGLSPAFCYGVFDDMILLSNNYYAPSPLGYFVYDTQTDSFHALEVIWAESDPVFKEEIRDFLLSKGITHLIGDCDSDNAITVMDATYIQKAMASLSAFGTDDEIPEYGIPVYGVKQKYVSDFDRDGMRTVLDATRIQKYKANLIDLDGNPIPNE